MFGIGTPELLLILVIALIVLGPKRLPEVGKQLGKALGELRRASQDLRDSIEIESRRADRPERVEPPSSVSRDPRPAHSTPPTPGFQPFDPAAMVPPEPKPAQDATPRAEPAPPTPGDPKTAG